MSKPVAKLIGADGNVFNLIGIAARALREGRLECGRSGKISGQRTPTFGRYAAVGESTAYRDDSRL